MAEAANVPHQMRTAVLTAAATIELQERPVPAPGPDEVLVRVGSVGVCGSDVHYYRHGKIGSFVVDYPLVLGHEVGGRIVGAGSAVDPGRVGERVALEPQRPCRRCPQCKAGRYNLCPHMRFFATPPVDGTFCDYVVLPADFAHPVPVSLSDDAVALLEPLSVGLWACHKAGVRTGSRVLVTGTGPIGAMAVQAARAAGATEIIVSDPVASRRERVLGFGATEALDPAAGFDVDELGVDAFIECSGATSALLDGVRSLRGAGAAVLVGHGVEEINFPVLLLQTKEITLTGVFRYVNTWPTAISLAAAGRVDLDSMVTARYQLERVEEALNADDDPSSMKTVVTVGE